MGPSSEPVAVMQKPIVSSIKAASSWAHVAGRPSRNPGASLKFCPVGRGLLASSGMADSGECIVAVWGIEPPAPVLCTAKCSAGDRTPWRLSFPTELPVLSVPLRASLVEPLRSPFPCPSPPSKRFVPKRFVLCTLPRHGLRRSRLAPTGPCQDEHLSTMHDAGVDEDDFACGDLTTLIDDQLRDFCRRVSCSRSSCSPFSLSVQSLQSSCCNLRLHVDFPFSAHPELKHSSSLPVDLPSHAPVQISRRRKRGSCECGCVNTCSFFHLVSGSNVHMEDLVLHVVVLHLSSRACPHERRPESV